jgi:hypothetical protein
MAIEESLLALTFDYRLSDTGLSRSNSIRRTLPVAVMRNHAQEAHGELKGIVAHLECVTTRQFAVTLPAMTSFEADSPEEFLRLSLSVRSEGYDSIREALA